VSFGDREHERFGWPVPDETLERVVRAVLDAGAVAVGIDLYRDTPQQPGSDKLAETLASDSRVVGIYRFSAEPRTGVGPPPSIKSPSRIGFSDMMRDGDHVVRRGLFFLSDEKITGTSLAVQTARLWLKAKGLGLRASESDPAHVQIGDAVFVPLDPDFGGYRGADAAGYQYLFDYRLPAGEVPTVAAGDLLDGKADLSALKDRVVYIGTISETVKDLFVTPPDAAAGRLPTSGVYLHALAADQIARVATGASRLTRTLPDVGEWALIVVAGLVAGLGVARGARWTTDLATVLATAIVISGACYLAFLRDWWLPVFPMLMATALTAVLVVTAKEIAEQRRRTALAGLLSNQVSPAVARDLWENRHTILDGTRPKPTRLEATVLFVDLEGSTEKADTLSPDDLVAWVGRFLEAMADAVVAHDGVIDKFTGDGLMAVFGVPVPRTTRDSIAADARSAVACAAEMARRLEALNAQAGERGFPRTRCRIGIHSGPLSAGNVSSRARMQYTVIRQTANLAARLEACGKDDPAVANDASGTPIDCRILLSEATKTLLETDTPLAAMGSVTLRGSQEPMAVFRLELAGTKTREHADA